MTYTTGDVLSNNEIVYFVETVYNYRQVYIINSDVNDYLEIIMTLRKK